jgi:hypothetical protein
VIDLIGAELIADATDAHVSLEDAKASGLLSSTAERDPALALARSPGLGLVLGAVALAGGLAASNAGSLDHCSRSSLP